MENNKDNIKQLLKDIKNPNDFIKSLEKYFKKNKELSDKQFECLFRFYTYRNK